MSPNGGPQAGATRPCTGKWALRNFCRFAHLSSRWSGRSCYRPCATGQGAGLHLMTTGLLQTHPSGRRERSVQCRFMCITTDTGPPSLHPRRSWKPTGMNPAGRTPGLSSGNCLAALRPSNHATLLLPPILVGLGILEGAISGDAPADLFPAGALLSLAAVGGYRAYASWMPPIFRPERRRAIRRHWGNVRRM